MKGSIPVINPDDLQSPHGHGQLMLQGLVILGLVYAAIYGIALYIAAANRARLADKAKRGKK